MVDARVKLGIAAALVIFVIGTSVALDDQQAVAPGKNGAGGPSGTLRLGYFPNINHAPAVIGAGSGDFQRALGPVKLETQLFNAGPAAVEALFASRIDCAYVGPNPAINGYLRSEGSIRAVSGVTSGGAVFVVRSSAGIDSPEDLRGKRLASPQLGNTQDVALRSYLESHGYDVRVSGGDPSIQPAKPSDILTAMVRGNIDGAWVPEPWGAMMVREAGGRIFVDERDLWEDGRFATSLIICRAAYVEANPGAVRDLLDAHVDKVLWINENRGEAVRQFNAEIDRLLGTPFDEQDLVVSLGRMEFTYDPLVDTVKKMAEDALRLGLLEDEIPEDFATDMFDLDILNDVLAARELDAV